MPKASKLKTRQTAGKGGLNKTASRETVTSKAKRVAGDEVHKGRKTTPIKKVVTTPITSPYTKSQVYNYVAEMTDLSRKEVINVFGALENLISRHLHKKGTGEFTIPGLAKCIIKHRPATKARKGVNPFTGEEMMYKAKAARNVVKIRPLKKLKAMVE